ncbi:MAG: hypothetical protein ISF22_09535, partial [Methanomassiliicoccus sp.]|nr:hypothetical protein [Methanomassiliicoccus sp.]
ECARRKGYFVVDVHGTEARVEAVDSVRRPGHLVNIDVSSLDGDAEVNRAIKLALKEADIDPATEPIVSVDLVGRPRFDLSQYDGGSMCSWIISLTGAVECLINDRTRFNPAGMMMTQRPMGHDAIWGEMASISSRLTPEETSDLVLRFRGRPTVDL